MRAGCEKVDVTISGRDIERKGARVRDRGAGERKREIVYYILGGSQSSNNVKPRASCIREKRRNNI